MDDTKRYKKVENVLRIESYFKHMSLRLLKRATNTMKDLRNQDKKK